MLMGVIILILVVLCILFATNTITFNHKEIKNEIENQENTSVKENEDKDTKEVLNNISVIFSEEKECENGCQKKISTTSGEKTLYVSQSEVKTISRFIDKDGNQYQIYPSYSQNEIFNISDDGTISFAGTKHIQGGLASSYITNLGETIDLCENGNEYKDDEIVSAIFKMKYLGNYKFDDISYVSTKTTIKDIRNCQ